MTDNKEEEEGLFSASDFTSNDVFKSLQSRKRHTEIIVTWEYRLQALQKEYEEFKIELLEEYTDVEEDDISSDRAIEMRSDLETAAMSYEENVENLRNKFYDSLSSGILSGAEEYKDAPHLKHQDTLLSILTEQMEGLYGSFLAIQRSEALAVSLNQRVGDTVFEVDPGKILSIVRTVNEVDLAKKLAASLGLSDSESSKIADLIIDKRLGRIHR